LLPWHSSEPGPRSPPIIEPMRRDASTVVVLAGETGEDLLAALGRAPNVSLVRSQERGGDPLPAAAAALREASRRSSSYALVPEDPLAGVAAAWQAMWDVTRGPGGDTEFERQAAEAVTSWRAGQFELPDYYLVLAGSGEEGQAGFHLGPLRATRPHRVAVVTPAPGGGSAEQPSDGRERFAAVLHALGSLRHGPWWPPLDELIGAARRFYPGGLAEGEGARGALLAPGNVR
jgi:hypothetical protein